MISLIERRRLALADIFSARNRLQEMKVSYEAGFAKVSEIKSWGDRSEFSFRPPPLNEGPSIGPVFEHREVVGMGSSFQESLADWRSWLDKCLQSGKELIWRVPPEIDFFCDFPSDKLIWKVYARLIIIPEEPKMTDITRKLELLANVKNEDPWPAELGTEINNWGNIVSAICAEALAEIQWLKRELKDYIVKDSKAMAEIRRLSVQHIQHSSPMIYTAPMSGRFVPGVGGFLPMQPQTPAAPEPALDPWGSSFAMNTENWK